MSNLYDLPQLTDRQDGAENTVNLNGELTEVLCGTIPVIDIDTTAQPGSPTEGDVYIVGSSATGDQWAGQDNDIAYYTGGQWYFVTPREGNVAYDQDQDRMVLWTGSVWRCIWGTQQTLTESGGTVSWDANISPNAQITLDGNHTIANPTGKQAGQFLELTVIQDATGTRVPTWGSQFRFAGGSITLSTGANDVDVLLFFWNGGSLREVSRSLNVS